MPLEILCQFEPWENDDCRVISFFLKDFFCFKHAINRHLIARWDGKPILIEKPEFLQPIKKSLTDILVTIFPMQCKPSPIYLRNLNLLSLQSFFFAMAFINHSMYLWHFLRNLQRHSDMSLISLTMQCKDLFTFYYLSTKLNE